MAHLCVGRGRGHGRYSCFSRFEFDCGRPLRAERSMYGRLPRRASEKHLMRRQEEAFVRVCAALEPCRHPSHNRRTKQNKPNQTMAPVRARQESAFKRSSHGGRTAHPRSILRRVGVVQHAFFYILFSSFQRAGGESRPAAPQFISFQQRVRPLKLCRFTVSVCLCPGGPGGGGDEGARKDRCIRHLVRA